MGEKQIRFQALKSVLRGRASTEIPLWREQKAFRLGAAARFRLRLSGPGTPEGKILHRASRGAPTAEGKTTGVSGKVPFPSKKH